MDDDFGNDIAADESRESEQLGENKLKMASNVDSAPPNKDDKNAKDDHNSGNYLMRLSISTTVLIVMFVNLF